MRQILMASVLLLGASWMFAQSSTTNQSGSATGSQQGYGQTSANTGTQKTVIGCLSEANGKYELTTKSGTMYDLMGDSSTLANHVGHEIKVTGTESAATGTAASDQTGEAQHSIEVSSMKHISKTCKNGSSMGGGMTK
jgi:hypothetical protein